MMRFLAFLILAIATSRGADPATLFRTGAPILVPEILPMPRSYEPFQMEPLPATVIIAVTVLDELTGRPIPHASIGVYSDPGGAPATFITNPFGICELTVRPRSDSISLHISARSYLSLSVPLWHPREPDFPFPSALTFRLKKGVTIGGTVIDEDGKPIPDATVCIMFIGSGPIETTFPHTATDSPNLSDPSPRTDASGHWTADGIFPLGYGNDINVMALHRGYQSDHTPHDHSDPDSRTLTFYRQAGITRLVRDASVDHAPMTSSETFISYLLAHPSSPPLPLTLRD